MYIWKPNEMNKYVEQYLFQVLIHISIEEVREMNYGMLFPGKKTSPMLKTITTSFSGENHRAG